MLRFCKKVVGATPNPAVLCVVCGQDFRTVGLAPGLASAP